jgi:hypothetical protein
MRKDRVVVAWVLGVGLVGICGGDAASQSSVLPQQQIVPAAPGAVYGAPPGGYPMPPGGFGGRGLDIFTQSDEPMGPGGQPGLNPSFIMSHQADRAYRGFAKSPDLGLEDLQAIDVGDTDGDGRPETVVADEDRVHIYKDVLSDTTRRVDVWPGRHRVKILAMDVGDVNRNGRAEIYVTAIQGNNETLSSSVIEYRDGRYEVIARELPYFLRVSRSLQEGYVLFGQEKRGRMMADRFSESLTSPYEKPFRLRWEGGKLVKGEVLPIKEEICILGLTLVDIDRDGVQEYLAFDTRDFLKLYNAQGGPSWVSSERYGRTANYFEKSFARPANPAEDPMDTKAFLPPRLLTVDLDGDGFEEVILCNNYEPLKLFPQSRIFSKSLLFSLSWDGTDFMENWRTREMKGYVSDFQVRDVDGDGRPELLIGLVYKRGTMDYFKTTATLIAFQLNVERSKPPSRDVKAEPKPKKEEEFSIFPKVKF